jgi:hypothetical protein
MPVVFNEPLSFLQRITEYMEYADLLEKACGCNDPVDRLKVRLQIQVKGQEDVWVRLKVRRMIHVVTKQISKDPRL